MPGPASVENLDLAADDKAIALNVTSAALGAGQVAPHMRVRGGGSIIFTASISGLVGSMMSPIYSAAKWGVVGLGKSLALAFAADNIRVKIVCPGLAPTPMTAGLTARSGHPSEPAQNDATNVGPVPQARPVMLGLAPAQGAVL